MPGKKSRQMSVDMSNNMNKKLSGWDVAISDTQEEIQRIKEEIRKNKERLADLKVALEVFQEKRDKGERFPGE